MKYYAISSLFERYSMRKSWECSAKLAGPENNRLNLTGRKWKTIIICVHASVIFMVG